MSASTTIAGKFARLRWRLLRGSVRGSGSEKAGVIVSTVLSAIVGLAGCVAIAGIARNTDDLPTTYVLFCSLTTFVMLGLSVVAGVTQPIDPRVIAAEPLSERERAVGLLTAAACGPPGIAACVIGVGAFVGAVRSPWSSAPLALAIVGWLILLLLISRTTTNLLGLLANRFPRVSQVTVGMAGLLFYALFQLVPHVASRMDDDGFRRAADVAAWSPPGQFGRAIATAGTSVPRSFGHLVIGLVAVAALAAAFSWSTVRLAHSVRSEAGGRIDAKRTRAFARVVRRLCGKGPRGAIAWRSLQTRFRTPRTVLETFTGAGVGLAAVIVPTVLNDEVGRGAVLVGGAVQVAVLFMSGNSFGVDGPALTNELLTGVDERVIVAGKSRSIAIVAAPLAVIGPTIVASLTGEWDYFLAGVMIGTGALMAGAGGAIVQSTLVPIAIPESDNPFAGGESGRGVVAAALLVAVLLGMTLITLPVALALLWATSRESVALVTLFGATTVGIGLGVQRLGERIATGRIAGRNPEFVSAVTPTR